MLACVDPKLLETREVQILHVVGRGLEHDLVLLVFQQTVGVLSVSAVHGAA